MKSKKICICKLVITFFFINYAITLSSNNVFAYTPPIGIPNPATTWGLLDPIEQITPSSAVKCPNWPASEKAGCYYIDPSHPDATDSGNTYGYPNKPRLTIANATYGPGTYMFLGGQVTTASVAVTFPCSEALPCWITSNSSDQGGFSGDGRVALRDSSFLFIENLLINNKTTAHNSNVLTISNTSGTTNSSHHVSVRNNTIRAIQYNSSNSVIYATARDGGSSHDIVYYNNDFANVGNPYATTDEDLHCFNAGLADTISSSYNIWALNNKWVDVGANGIQINGGKGNTSRLHHIYVGKNYGKNGRQRIISVKQCSHVIISQNNSIPGINRAAGYVSETGGWQYGPDYVWFLFNDIHDGANGLRASDSTGGTIETSHIFVIGNQIHNVAPNEYQLPFDPTSNWRVGSGIYLMATNYTLHLVDNTFYNNNSGLLVNQPSVLLYIHGNILSGIYPGDTFVDFALNSDTSTAHISNNLYYDAEGNQNWRYHGTNYATLDLWKAAFPLFDKDSQNVDPLFIDAAVNNFTVNSSSTAIGANKDENKEYGYPDVYALFESLYGINIRVDYNGNPRPASGAWALGAFESISTLPASTTLPAPTFNTINIQ